VAGRRGARIDLGVDTLCYHLRLTRGEVSHEEVIREISDAGFRTLQLNAKSGGLDGWDLRSCRRLGDTARRYDVALVYSGMDIGRSGDNRRAARARARRWLRQAKALGSSILRVYSRGFWQELPHEGAAHRAELDFLERLLPEIEEDAGELGIIVALENHSNLPAAELRELIRSVDSPTIRVHLDLINHVSVFENDVRTIELLAPYAVSGHVRDFAVETIPNPDGAHRMGFRVLWRYPGEGLADFGAMLPLLSRRLKVSRFPLTIEGLDHEIGETNQVSKLTRAREVLEQFL
jgi:sugar phosphate isomerase/epimerase